MKNHIPCVFMILFAYCVVTNIFAQDNDIQSSRYSYAWFLPISEEGKIYVIAVQNKTITANNVMPVDSLAILDSSVTPVKELPFSTLKETLSLNKQINDSVQTWFPNQSSSISSKKEGLSTIRLEYNLEKKLFLPSENTDKYIFPLLQYSPNANPIYSGTGKELLASDLPLWFYWRPSKLFFFEKTKSFLIFSNSAQAYLSTAPPKNVLLLDDYKNVRLPLLIGGNPFLIECQSKLKVSELPKLSSACFWKEQILITTDSGYIEQFNLGVPPIWSTKLPESLFGDGRLFLLPNNDRLHAIYHQEGKSAIEKISEDGKTWKYLADIPEFNKNEVPLLYASPDLLVVLRSPFFNARGNDWKSWEWTKDKNWETLLFYKREGGNKWKEKDKYEIGNKVVLDVVYDSNKKELYALLGDHGGAGTISETTVKLTLISLNISK